MNLGFFGFPSYLDTSIIQIAKYDYSGTFYVPEYCNFLDILVIGGGGGGGGGRRSTSGTSAYGGGGGASGCLSYDIIPVTDLTDNYETKFTKSRLLGIEIGAGGAGGARATVNQTNGGNGSGGGHSYVYIFDLRWNTLSRSIILFSRGGDPGRGGTNNLGTAAAESDTTGGNYHNGVWRGQFSNGSSAAINDTSKNTYRNLPNYSWGSSGGSVQSNGTTKNEKQLNLTYSNVNTTVGQVFLGYSDPSNYIAQGGVNGDQFKNLTNVIGHAGAGGYAINTGGLLSGSENGGYGIRGGGGGGGGGGVEVNSGSGGKGGNGFCLIIART